MVIELFDTKEFITINKLQEITSPIVFERGGIPNPDGLVSNEIFGLTTKDRRQTFAYIDLHGYFFHPHIYKALKRIFPNLDKIINGESYYSLDKDGSLVLDENGETGIEFLYEIWDKIKWKKSDKIGMRNERIRLIENTPKNIIFTRYQIVIPAFYRDIKTGENGKAEQDDINKYYTTLIRLSKVLADKNMFAFTYHNTNFNIQTTMISIYEYFRDKLKGKKGMLRKYLMGKNVDYCTRSVITAEVFHSDTPEENEISYEYSSIPISQCITLCAPFVKKYILDFFEREIIDQQNAKIIYDPEKEEIVSGVELDKPELVFTDKYVTKIMHTYMRDPDSRFNKIEVPVVGSKKKYYLAFTGMKPSAAEPVTLNSSIGKRPMCITDLMYMACSDVTKDKHVMITRYPILDSMSTFITRIRISSTIETEPMIINGQLHRYYPVIDYNVPREHIGSHFIDAIRFSNSYLEGLDEKIAVEYKHL